MKKGGAFLKTLLICALMTAAVAPAWAETCRADRYEVVGSVVDPGDRPVDATVYLLLDRASKKKSRAAGGIRARSTRTDRAGRFHRQIVCGDAPDPCAAKPKHLTVGVDVSGRMTWKVFELKNLETAETAEGCAVRVPEIRLSF